MATVTVDPSELIPFTEVPKRKGLVPARRNGKRLAVETLYRWARNGSHGIRLQVFYVGAQPCVTPAGLREFFAAVGAAKYGQQLAPQTDAAAQTATEKRLRAAKAM